MNRRQRLLATLQGKSVDRPAVSFYEIGGIRMNPSDDDPFNVYSDPSWKPLIDLAEERTDLIRMRSPVRAHSHESWDSSNADGESVRSHFFKTEQTIQDDCLMTKLTVTANGREMTAMTME